MFNNKKWLVILLSGRSLTIMPPEAESPTIIPVPETLVANLELKNRDGVELMVADWCKQRTYANTAILWLLAEDLVFETILPTTDKDLWEQKASNFLEAVPFEHTLSRRYTTEQGTLRVIATNHELIMAFVQSFAKHGYAPVALIPLSLIPKATSLTKEVRDQAMGRSSELIAASLLTTTGNPIGGSETATAPTQVKSQLPLLLGVFAILLVILVIVIVLNY